MESYRDKFNKIAEKNKLSNKEVFLSLKITSLFYKLAKVKGVDPAVGILASLASLETFFRLEK